MPYICDAIWWETRTVSMLMPSSPKSTLGVRDACSQLDGPRLSHAGSVLARGRLAPCCRVTYTAQQTQQITSAPIATKTTMIRISSKMEDLPLLQTGQLMGS